MARILQILTVYAALHNLTLIPAAYAICVYLEILNDRTTHL